MGTEYQFCPIGHCRVATPDGTYLLDPDGTAGGRYVYMRNAVAPSGLDWGALAVRWLRFAWVHWCPDDYGPGFRLRIGATREPENVAIVVTGPVDRIEGEFVVSENLTA